MEENLEKIIEEAKDDSFEQDEAIVVQIEKSMLDKKYEIPQHVKNYLTAGQNYYLYKPKGDRKLMHIFLTPDLMEILAVRPGSKQIKNQWRI